MWDENGQAMGHLMVQPTPASPMTQNNQADDSGIVRTPASSIVDDVANIRGKCNSFDTFLSISFSIEDHCFGQCASLADLHGDDRLLLDDSDNDVIFIAKEPAGGPPVKDEASDDDDMYQIRKLTCVTCLHQLLH